MLGMVYASFRTFRDRMRDAARMYSSDPTDPSLLLLSYIEYAIVYENLKKICFWVFLSIFIIELAFFIFIELRVLPRLRPVKQPLPYNTCPVELIDRILNVLTSLKSYKNSDFVRGFFLGADVDDIYYENIRSFLAWVMYGVKEESLSDSQRKDITKCYTLICKKCKLNPKPGFNPNVKHVSVSWDDVTYIHRPLLLYTASYLVDVFVTFVGFRMRGFRQYELYGMKYWYHPGKQSVNSSTPVIFFHGITPGWMAYINFVHNISQGRPVFLVEVGGIKIKSMEFSMPTPEEFADSVRSMLRRHHFKRASLIGHSFGSITSGWFLKHYPDMVTHITLIDPVSLLLSLPDVAYKFLYRKPTKLVEWIIYIYASTEITISHTLRRNFYWYRSVLWLDDIPSSVGVVVAVAGNDEIINPEAVHEYSINHKIERSKLSLNSRSNMEVLLFPKFSHGQILVDFKAQKSLIAAINQTEKKYL